MPPQKTIIVDARMILLGIREASDEMIDEMKETHRIDRSWCLHRDRQSILDGWTDYAIPAWIGREYMSESELQIWRREVRRLAREDFIDLDHRMVRLTEKGQQRVDEIVAEMNGE